MFEPALLAAIAAAPDDDLPRLVYADWLEENGRPLRAEFIRLQIEIAKKETLPRAVVNVYSHLWKRQQEILDDHRDELLGSLTDFAPILGRVEFRRGFVDDLTISVEDFVSYGGVVAGLLPLPERVRVVDVEYEAARFFGGDTQGLDSITDLSSTPEGGDLSRNIVNHLTLFRAVSDWPRLRTLDLEASRIGDVIHTLFERPNTFPALQDLDLSFNDLTDAGVIALLNTGVPQRLKRLVLGGNPIGDEGAVALAEALANSPVLESLNLRMTNIGQAGQAALLGALGGKVDLF